MTDIETKIAAHKWEKRHFIDGVKFLFELQKHIENPELDEKKFIEKAIKKAQKSIATVSEIISYLENCEK
jgi:hypothetical protein